MKTEIINDMDDFIDKVTDLGIEKGWLNDNGWISDELRNKAHSLIYQEYEVKE